MTKKKIVIDGVEYLSTKDTDPDPKDPVDPDPKDPAGDADVQEAAKAIAASVRKELGLDDLKETIKAAQNILNKPENAKLREIFHGKDLQNKDQLTTEEKIVGFFHALVSKNEPVVKALSEGVDADGGYLFPNEFLAELVKPLANPGTMRSLVRVITMRRDVLNAPSMATRPKLYWTAENAAKSTTTATFGQITLTVKKAAAILYASDELIEDSTEIDAVRLIIDLFSEAITEEEDRVILRGNGTTEPTGIETARAAGTIASVAFGGQTTFDNLKTLKYALKAKYRKNATWLIHPNKVAAIDKLKDSDGRYIWQEGATAEAPTTLLGMPVSEQYDLPENTIFLGNWKLAYWLGDRKRMTVKISNDTETAFTKDQTAIRVVMRIAGNVVLGEAAKAGTGA